MRGTRLIPIPFLFASLPAWLCLLPCRKCSSCVRLLFVFQGCSHHPAVMRCSCANHDLPSTLPSLRYLREFTRRQAAFRLITSFFFSFVVLGGLQRKHNTHTLTRPRSSLSAVSSSTPFCPCLLISLLTRNGWGRRHRKARTTERERQGEGDYRRSNDLPIRGGTNSNVRMCIRCCEAHGAKPAIILWSLSFSLSLSLPPSSSYHAFVCVCGCV